MSASGFLLLLISAMIGCAAPQMDEDKAQCAVDPSDRRDCGYPGITPRECYNKGCCFNSSISGVKWCFFPVQAKECSGSPQLRRNCGYPGISAKECKERNCCFDSSIPGVNWCFYTQTVDKAQCSVDPSDRRDCGYPRITAKKCYNKGCCFNSSVPGVKWCFFPDVQGTGNGLGSFHDALEKKPSVMYYM